MTEMRHAIFSRFEAIHSPEREEVRGKLLPQLHASAVSAFTNLGIGAVMGYSGVTFPDLTHPKKHDLIFDQMEVELFGSLAYLGSIFGCILSGLVMVWWGQRRALLIALPLALIGWILLGIGNSIWMVQIARLLLGIYVGFGYSCAGNYVTEIAHHSIRGQLSSLVNISRQLGFVLVYGLGSTNITWRQLAFVSGGLTIIGPFFGLLKLPDSPRWLASVEKFEEARKSLLYLRGELYDVDSELKLITSHFELKNSSGTLGHQLKEIANPMILRRFVLLNVLFILFSVSGNCTVVTYTATIFKYANNYLNEYQSTITIGVFRTLGAFAFLFVSDKFSRRTFTLLAMLIMSVCMFNIGLYFYLKENHDVSNLRWIPLMSLSLHQFFGLFNPINFLPSELLPTSVRSIGASLIWMISFVFSFVIVFTFPIMQDNIGLYGTFWVYSMGCFAFYVITLFHLPESGGISLEIVNENPKEPETNQSIII